MIGVSASPLLHTGAIQGGKTYAQFEAHLTALGFNSFMDWDSNSANSGAIGVRANSSPIAQYTMFGSSWLGVYSNLSVVLRVVQHGLPSEAAFNDQRSNERLLRLIVETAPNAAVSGSERNGYASQSRASGQVRRCTEILAWIDGQPMRMQPSLGLGPEPYDW